MQMMSLSSLVAPEKRDGLQLTAPPKVSGSQRVCTDKMGLGDLKLKKRAIKFWNQCKDKRKTYEEILRLELYVHDALVKAKWQNKNALKRVIN